MRAAQIMHSTGTLHSTGTCVILILASSTSTRTAGTRTGGSARGIGDLHSGHLASGVWRLGAAAALGSGIGGGAGRAALG